MAESSGAGSKTRGRGVTIFLIGLVLGVLGTLFIPDLLAPYLPDSLQKSEDTVTGLVTAKERQADKLLLTVDSPNGAVLATFSKKVAEISLLVDQGDSVTLAVRLLEPFVDDPTIRQVHKARGRATSAPPEDAVGETPEPADTVEAPPDTTGAGEGAEESATEAETAAPLDS